MAGMRLGAGARHIRTESLDDGQALHGVILRRTGAMQVDPAQIPCRKPRPLQGGLDGLHGPFSIRTG